MNQIETSFDRPNIVECVYSSDKMHLNAAEAIIRNVQGSSLQQLRGDCAATAAAVCLILIFHALSMPRSNPLDPANSLSLSLARNLTCHLSII